MRWNLLKRDEFAFEMVDSLPSLLRGQSDGYARFDLIKKKEKRNLKGGTIKVYEKTDLF